MKSKEIKKEAPKRNFVDSKTLIPLLKKCKRIFVDEYYIDKDNKKEVNRRNNKQSIKGIKYNNLPSTPYEGYYNFSISYTKIFPTQVIKIPVKYEHVDFLSKNGIINFVNGLNPTLHIENEESNEEENNKEKQNDDKLEESENISNSIFDRKYYEITDKIHTDIDVIQMFEKLR